MIKTAQTGNLVIPNEIDIIYLLPYSVEAGCQNRNRAGLIHFTNLAYFGLSNFIDAQTALHWRQRARTVKAENSLACRPKNWSDSFCKATCQHLFTQLWSLE
ncbi:hypothetical protein D3C81_99880 [compost metagenome]